MTKLLKNGASLIIITIILVLVENVLGDTSYTNDSYKIGTNQRTLKAKGGGGGKPKGDDNTGASSESLDDGDEIYVWRPDPNYKFTYGSVKNEVNYKNDYWDPAYSRTMLPLYTYYQRQGMKFEKGYYSEVYKKTYYDGYGYNYYYGGYGYYEYAINDTDPSKNVPYAILFGVVFMMCFIGTALSVNKCNKVKNTKERK